MVVNVSKSSTTLGVNTKTQINDFLLKEDSGYLLQETGDKIILEQSQLHPVVPTNQSKGTSTISMITKSP